MNDRPKRPRCPRCAERGKDSGMDSFGCVVCGNTKNDYEYQAAKLREEREPEVKVRINDEEYSVVSLTETAHTLLHDPAADGVTKGMANAVMALCERVEAIHREERMRADDQAQAWRNNRALSEKIDRCEVYMREILGYEEGEPDAGLEAMIVALKHYYAVTKKVDVRGTPPATHDA